jgi:hypothetical protein
VTLRIALFAIVAAVVAAGALAVLLGSSQAGTEAGAFQQTVSDLGATSAVDDVVPGPESATLSVIAVNDACDYYRGFHALRVAAGPAGARNTNTQSQTSVSTSTNISRSRVVINGVVVFDETIDASQVQRNDSSGTSQSTSTSVSVSSSSSGSHSRVTVNGVVVHDERTEVTSTSQNSLLSVLTTVIAKRLQFETMLLMRWHLSAVAGPGCAP